jgi:hypothetical protein
VSEWIVKYVFSLSNPSSRISIHPALLSTDRQIRQLRYLDHVAPRT